MPCIHNRLQYLRGWGVPIALCSARPPESVNLVARRAGLNGPVACCNGGLIFDEHSTILWDVGIDIQLAMDFTRFVSCD